MKGGERNTLGRWGEEQAAQFLQRNGYGILETRYRKREGEVDLIAENNGFLCFVEVKLRKNTRMGEAREYVTASKQRKVRIAAEYYLMEHPGGLQPRFDVIEVYAPNGTETKTPVIRHWENAF